MLYHRHNLTEELLAELFSTSQPTISRAINTIEKALAKTLRPMERSLENSLKIPGSLLVDGTLIPTLADKGYIGLGLATPRRPSKTRRTPSDVKVVNRFINSRRAVVERGKAQVETWRILHTGFRRLLDSHARVFSLPSARGFSLPDCWTRMRGCSQWYGGWYFMQLEGLLNKPHYQRALQEILKPLNQPSDASLSTPGSLAIDRPLAPT